jgi:hypothetical protein
MNVSGASGLSTLSTLHSSMAPAPTSEIAILAGAAASVPI